jgi:hypothetical protein
MPTIEENLVNMRRCPRFDNCSIPKCPLDFWMSERAELPEDGRCPLAMKTKGKRRGGKLTASMNHIRSFLHKKNEVGAKTSTQRDTSKKLKEKKERA